jgi:Uma2 family endonuclease
MSAIVLDNDLRIPAWVGDFDSFRRWTLLDEFPERGVFSHLNGQLWVESMETLVHNKIKTQIAAVLLLLAQAGRLGDFLGDRMRLINLDVLLSTEPDGMFISRRTLKRRLVKLREGDQTLEMIGTPDMVLEVVSKTSADKDLVVLPDLYFRAGVAEYWLVDARPGQFRFTILRPGRGKYVAVRPVQGWLKSRVFGKAFKLSRTEGAEGVSEFRLEVR